MPATTEIYTLSLKTGSDDNEQHGCTASMLHDCCDAITCQEGLQKLWYGTELENPKRLQLFLRESMTMFSYVLGRSRVLLMTENSPAQ